jgi:hypothetical protein
MELDCLDDQHGLFDQQINLPQRSIRRSSCRRKRGAPRQHRPHATALENLRTEVVDIEASGRQRAPFGLLQSLITRTSQQASPSLRFTNARAIALEPQMKARGKAPAR